MTAHGRYEKRLGAGPDQYPDGGFHDLLKIGDAAAANAQGNFIPGVILSPTPLLENCSCRRRGKSCFFESG